MHLVGMYCKCIKGSIIGAKLGTVCIIESVSCYTDNILFVRELSTNVRRCVHIDHYVIISPLTHNDLD